MRKQAISVTLAPDNLLWLRGRALATGQRSVSQTLDGLIAEARAGRGPTGGGASSIVGRIRISESDPGLDQADAAIRALFCASLGRRAPSKRGRPGAGRRRAPGAGKRPRG